MRKVGGRRIADGETLCISVDSVEWSIRWKVGENVQYTCSIPASMRSKTVYFVVMMIWKDNVIELRVN